MAKYLIFILLIFIMGCGRTSYNGKMLLDIHNKERQQRGVAVLSGDSGLDKIAQDHAEWMAKTQRLTHQSLNVIMENWSTGGENIAYGQESEQSVVNTWMRSSGHKKNILSKNYTHAGFGKASAKNGTIYWCVDFGG